MSPHRFKSINLWRSRDNVATRRRVNKMFEDDGHKSTDNVATRRRVYKMFEDDGHNSTDVVYLCDSDQEEIVNVGDKSKPELGSYKESDSDKYEDEDVEVNTSTPLLSFHKRKHIISSNSENDDEDDNIRISIVKNLKSPSQEMFSDGDKYEDEDVEVNTSTPLPGRYKRKLVISSDSETDDEDYIIVKNMKSPNQPGRYKRKLVISSDSETDDEDYVIVKNLKSPNQEQNFFDGVKYEDVEVNTSTHLLGRYTRELVISSDSEADDEDNIIVKNLKSPNQELTFYDGDKYEDKDVELNTSTPFLGRHKRKHVIISDSETDEEDDNTPISILKNLKSPNQEMSDLIDTPPPTKESSGHVSESESLDGFIVHDDDDDDCHETGEEESDGEIRFGDVISRLRRDRNPEKRKWEYEGDMLADFGKDDKLCMRVVCVLYRFQTEDEKATRSSHVSNGRGFNQFDADRGTLIGRFLTDGDPKGDLKKSVEELKSFNFDAVEICRELASRYSSQLFQIFNNREDPFFAAPSSP